MVKIDAKRIIKDGHYSGRLVCYWVFFIVPILMAVAFLAVGGGDITYRITMFCVILVVAGVPFGYLLGIKKILEVGVVIRKLKKGDFFVKERRVVEMHCVKQDQTRRTCYIQYEEKSKDGYVWVTRDKGKAFSVGDACYVVFLKGNAMTPYAIYNKENAILDEGISVATGD